MEKFKESLEVLKKHKNELPGSNKSEREEYFNDLENEINKLISRTNNDRSLATQIAVDASKTFVQIAIAVFVAIGGFYQFGFKNNWETLPVIGLGLSALLTFLSMCFGFVVISKAYKRGDGRQDIDQIAWSTEALKNVINCQAWTGVAALIVFAVSILLQG